MILPDLNLLLYAYNPCIPQHAKSHQWWTEVINGPELIGLPHEILFGFIRIATNQRLGTACVPLAAAKATVDGWLNLPNSRIILPDTDHYYRVTRILQESMATGAIVSDAILASYAIYCAADRGRQLVSHGARHRAADRSFRSS